MSASVAIRASSLGELVDCPARWEAKHLLGRGGTSPHLLYRARWPEGYG